MELPLLSQNLSSYRPTETDSHLMRVLYFHAPEKVMISHRGNDSYDKILQRWMANIITDSLLCGCRLLKDTVI